MLVQWSTPTNNPQWMNITSIAPTLIFLMFSYHFKIIALWPQEFLHFSTKILKVHLELQILKKIAFFYQNVSCNLSPRSSYILLLNCTLKEVIVVFWTLLSVFCQSINLSQSKVSSGSCGRPAGHLLVHIIKFVHPIN